MLGIFLGREIKLGPKAPGLTAAVEGISPVEDSTLPRFVAEHSAAVGYVDMAGATRSYGFRGPGLKTRRRGPGPAGAMETCSSDTNEVLTG